MIAETYFKNLFQFWIKYLTDFISSEKVDMVDLLEIINNDALA